VRVFDVMHDILMRRAAAAEKPKSVPAKVHELAK
jgi:hypothetical protein